MLLELWRQLVGNVPQYSDTRYYYGELTEYAFVCLLALLVLCLLFRLIVHAFSAFTK